MIFMALAEGGLPHTDCPHPPFIPLLSPMQDQLVIFMALAEGESRMLCTEPTMHTRTAMAVAEQMLPGAKFEVSVCKGKRQREGGGRLWLVKCRGAGIESR